jgi:large subunit ribosomal protein L17
VRHRVYGKHLGRSKDQRTALFKSLVRSLILEESIKTTEPKAKAVKGLVDKIITQAKSPTSKRMVSQFLVHKVVTDKLDQELLPRMQSRTSGYTSMVKLGARLGDGAMMVKLSLILEESRVKSQESSKKEKKTVEKSKDAEIVEAEIMETPVKKAAKSAKKEAKKS